MTSSSFDITNKIVVDVDIPFLVIVHPVFLTDLKLLNQSHEGGTVKLLQIVVMLYHIQPCVYGLLVFTAVGKLFCQLPAAFLLGFSLGLITVEKLDT